MWRSRLRRAVALLGMGMIVAGCSDLFTVSNPIDVTEEELELEALLDAIRNVPEAAVAETYSEAILYGGLVGDGIMQPSTASDNLRLDRGDISGLNQFVEPLYNDLAAGRWMATDARRRLEERVANPGTDPYVGRAYFWDAIARITLADLFEGVTFDQGPEVSPADTYEMALALLEQAAAIFQASNETNYLAGTYATISRAHRSLYFERGREGTHLQTAREFAELALATLGDFRVEVRYQLPGSANGVYTGMSTGLGHTSTGSPMIELPDPVTGEWDPRVRHGEFLGNGPRGDPYHWQEKYTDRNDNIPVSRWQEAALIAAEAYLEIDELQTALEHLNAVRAAAGLPEFQTDDPDEARLQLRHERKVEFWLELRMWSDHRYYESFPERWTSAFRDAGLQRRLPISLRERTTNPNLQGPS